MSDSKQVLSQKTDWPQALICGSLFAVFSFVYLYVFQRDVLEALHFSLAHGKTVFSALGSAFVITFVLLLIRWGLNRFLRLGGAVYALSYFPLFLVLGLLTDIGYGIYASTYHTNWGWLFPLLLLVYILVAILVGKLFRTMRGFTVPLLTVTNSNLLIMLVLCLMTILIGNANNTLHYELKSERLLREKSYSEALTVGIHASEPTQTLTALRAYALAHTGEMGEKLFNYPQNFGAKGLFFPDDSLKTFRYTNDSVFNLLGVPLQKVNSVAGLLHDMCHQGTGSHVALDYYLSALLLDKKLDTFVKELSYFQIMQEDLPLYYREAVVLWDKMHPDSVALSKDSLMLQRYGAYLENERQLSQETFTAKKNRMHKDYGTTYWWYYNYGGE